MTQLVRLSGLQNHGILILLNIAFEYRKVLYNKHSQGIKSVSSLLSYYENKQRIETRLQHKAEQRLELVNRMLVASDRGGVRCGVLGCSFLWGAGVGGVKIFKLLVFLYPRNLLEICSKIARKFSNIFIELFYSANYKFNGLIEVTF